MKHRTLVALAITVAMPALAAAQQVTIVERGTGRGAGIVESLAMGPHTVRGGTGALILPADSTITTSLLVLGRPTFLASHVRGDVVVVGSDLFLRPGADVSGRAIAIGGTVSQTTLGHVGGSVESLRDETFLVQQNAVGDGYSLTARTLRVGGDDTPPLFRLAGLFGVQMPHYDRVDGLSLPVGIELRPASERLVIQPSVTYRSRLGVVDPSVALRVGPEEGTRFEGRVARDTRSNDLWISPEIINSLTSLAFGLDTRNYFRSDIAEGRMFLGASNARMKFEPFAGVRVERVSPITAVGNVFSFFGRSDSLKMSRPNPSVEKGTIGSALVGAVYESLPSDAPLTSHLELQAEQSVTTPTGTSSFTQFTMNGQVEFPTFSTQRLRVRGHAVGSLGDSIPRARYAYLGGSRTLGLTDLLSLGGGQLVFVESKYLIPLNVIQLPVVGSPTLSLIDRIGGAGVHSVGPLQQEVGASIGVGAMGGGIDLEYMVGASGQHRSSLGVNVSLPSF